jgi:hypothetical protein
VDRFYDTRFSVTAVWQRMANMSPAQIPKLVDQMTREQPQLLAYLMAASESDLNQDEAEIVFYIGVVVWRIMRENHPAIRKVTEKLFDQVEAENEKSLVNLEEDSPADFVTAVKKFTNDYPEPEVLRYVVEALIEEDEEDESGSVGEENLGLAFIILKNVLDALIASRAE